MNLSFRNWRSVNMRKTLKNGRVLVDVAFRNKKGVATHIQRTVLAKDADRTELMLKRAVKIYKKRKGDSINKEYVPLREKKFFDDGSWNPWKPLPKKPQ